MHLKAFEVCTQPTGIPHYSLICKIIVFLKVRLKPNSAEKNVRVLPMLQLHGLHSFVWSSTGHRTEGHGFKMPTVAPCKCMYYGTEITNLL